MHLHINPMSDNNNNNNNNNHMTLEPIEGQALLI